MRAQFFTFASFTRNAFVRRTLLLAMAAALLLVPAAPRAAQPAPAAAPPAPAFLVQPDIGINGFYSADKAQRGRMVQAAVVVSIPGGFHINANKLIGKIGIPTSLKVEATGGVRVGPIIYPRATVRRLKISDEQLALYEGRAVIRFNVTIPPNYPEGMTELRARLRYQSCNDEVCFPPTTREIALPIGIVGPNDSVRRINSNLFGGGRRSRG